MKEKDFLKYTIKLIREKTRKEEEEYARNEDKQGSD